MDNISEARTEIESIVAPPSNHSNMATTSISQEPIFDGGERHQSFGDDENADINVSDLQMCSISLFEWRKNKNNLINFFYRVSMIVKLYSVWKRPTRRRKTNLKMKKLKNCIQSNCIGGKCTQLPTIWIQILNITWRNYYIWINHFSFSLFHFGTQRHTTSFEKQTCSTWCYW